MTTLDGIFERAPVDRISAEARQVSVGRALAALTAAVLLFIGRSAGWVVNALVWMVVAVRVGYREARPAPPAAPQTRVRR